MWGELAAGGFNLGVMGEGRIFGGPWKSPTIAVTDVVAAVVGGFATFGDGFV